MTTYDISGNPVLPAGVEEFLSGNPSTYIDSFIRTRFGPIVKDVDTGIIADDPSDVIVLVNSVPATVTAVIGLLGIIVLDSPPLSTDEVKIWYNYLPRTRVEFRRLNSTEFVLNADGQRAHGCQRYLYENVLIDPSIENPSGFQGGAPQTDPELVGHFYRAFERAYSVALNDPNLLLLNSPHHKISYPPFSRALSETLASYDGNVLPENNVNYPWSIQGSGSASVDGILTIEDSTSGEFPIGEGFYYYRVEDLSFQYNMSFSFRAQVTSYSLSNDFSGVGAGFIDGNYLCLLSFLESSGTKYIGVLKKDGDETIFSSYESYELDWSDNHIYRLYRTVDQVSLYVDSGSLPVLTVSVFDLARGNELEISIPFISGSFFGSLNREATNISKWDYLRYLITPEYLNESSHTVAVLYEANNLPKDASNPWFTTGAFGTETLLALETLLLDKISASEEPYGSESGFLSGEIFGYHRPEPFLTDQSILTVDWKSRAYSWTHAISERSLGVFVDDFTKFLGVSFFSDSSLSLLSYNGQMLPENDPETPWKFSGSAVRSILDNYLNIEDSSDTIGALYNREDIANDILGYDKNYIYEFRTRVNSYTADASGFVGVLTSVFDGVPGVDSGSQIASLSNLPAADTVTVTGLFSSSDVGRQIEISGSTQGNDGVYDIISFVSVNQVQVSPSFPGTIPEATVTANLLGGYPGRSVEIQLREEGSGTQVISFSSNGSVLSSIPYSWEDDFHTYRIIVNQGSDLVLLLVDGISKGSLPYSSFTKSAGDIATFSFGSSNTLETSISDVDWDYFNSYPIRDSSTDYVGVYKGGDTSDLDNYDYITIDFTSYHEYRLVRDPNGSVSLFVDGVLRISFPYLDLPDINESYFYPQKSSGIYWGSYDESALVLSEWDYLRYSISGLTGLDITAPHHQILNQQNVIASADHLYVNGHGHTNFLSSSTGIPYPYDEYYDVRDAEDADTKLNVDTPPVPLTEEAYLTKIETPVSTLNDPLLQLNDVQFLSNDASTKVELEVNDRGLYNTLDLRSKNDGNELDKIYPAFDNGPVGISFDISDTLSLLYEADLVPELEGWSLEGFGTYSSFASSGILTFLNWGSGSRYYLNENPIFTSDFITALEFSFKVVQDISSGTDDTGIRFELNNGSISIELGLFTSPLNEKIVQVFSGDNVVGNISFNWDDSSFHTYKLKINPYDSVVSVYIDSGSRSYMDIPFSKFIATNDVSLSFTPKNDPLNAGTSEIEVDFVRFYVYRNDDYEIASDINNRSFYLNAYDDFTYSSYTVPAKSLLNSSNILYPGSKFNEAFPALSIDGLVDETYPGASDEALVDEIALTYTWGGNILNDPETKMELDLVTGFLLNDFTSGSIVYPLDLSPVVTTAVLGASLTVSGSDLFVWSLDHNHTVRITGVGAVDTTSTEIIGAGGSWNATTIVIPLSLIPGVVASTSQVLVQVYGSQSNVVTIS